MHDLGCAGGDLMVVERNENVLRVAAVDAVAVPVEHEHIHEMRPRIDRAGRIEPAAAADHPSPAGDGHVQPNFV